MTKEKNDNEEDLITEDIFKPKKTGFKTFALAFLELSKILILAFLTIALVRYFLFKPFYVKGASMEPNFFDHEYLIIDELSYRFRVPARGEVIVFRTPSGQKDYFLKRIVGLPGERVKTEDGRVIIYNNDHPEGIVVEENYLDPNLPTLGEKQTTLGTGEYFVLGDNRLNSFDSRRFGAVDADSIVGRAWLRGWPINRIQAFQAPEFNF